MDFTKIAELFQGNGLLILLLAVFLFKDQILAFFNKTPAPAPAPVPLPVPLPGPAPAPVIDRPILDAIAALLPVILPYITQLLEKGAADAKAKEQVA